MSLENNFSNISLLNVEWPTPADGKNNGDDHVRGIKYSVKMTFPFITGTVTASHTELNYVDGVTSAIQDQFTGVQGQITTLTSTKGAIAGQVWTGAHDFSGASGVLVPTPTLAGQAATKGYADGLSFASALPGQGGNAGKIITTNGTSASWVDAVTFEGLLAPDVATSATPNIWAGLGKLVQMTGSVAVTGFTAAPRAGAVRTLVAVAGFVLTNGANLVVKGGTITLLAGDEVEVTAMSTTTFRATVTRADGTPVADKPIPHYNSGTVSILDYRNGQSQAWAPASGVKTLSVTNWPASGFFAELRVRITNAAAGGALSITGVKYVKPDGTFTADGSAASATAAGIVYQTAGIDFLLLFTDDGGTTIYAKVMR